MAESGRGDMGWEQRNVVNGNSAYQAKTTAGTKG